MSETKNPDIATAEDLAEKKLEIEDIKIEQARLKKMLKIGFDTKTEGMDRTAKALATNDEKKLAKFYVELLNGIRAIAIAGHLEKFQIFAATYGVNVEAAGTLNYLKKGKKKEKFLTLFSEYFLDNAPTNGTDAAARILKAMQANFSQIHGEEDALKEEAEGLSYSCSKRTFDTITKVLVSSRKKDMPVEDVISDIELKLQDEQQAIDILEKEAGE